MAPVSFHSPVFRSRRRKSDVLPAPTTSVSSPRLVVDRQQVVAAREHDRPIADHHARMVVHHEGVRPRLARSREILAWMRDVDQVAPYRTT